MLLQFVASRLGLPSWADIIRIFALQAPKVPKPVPFVRPPSGDPQCGC
jgi:hypothetical protein